MQLLRLVLLDTWIAVLVFTGCSLQRPSIAPAGLDGGGVELDVGAFDVPPIDDAPRMDAPMGDGGLDSPDTSAVDAGTDVPLDAPVDGGCSSGPRCLDGMHLETCTAGVLSSTTCLLGCSYASPNHCRVVSPSNVPPTLFDPAASDVNITSNTSWNTSDCTTLPGGMQVSASGIETCVVRANVFTVRTSRTLTITGPRPVILLVNGDVAVAGTIDVSARGITPGPGGGVGAGPASTGPRGPWYGFDGSGFSYNDGGGGGGGFCGGGGAGGTGGAANGGPARAPVEGLVLMPLFGGSGGGRGGPGESAGVGGGGGGALQITTRGTLRVTGAILAAGGGGAGGGDGTTADDNIGAGGGGGSGGAVLLEGLFVEIMGVLDVSGGGGGGSAGCRTRGDASAGSDGAESVGPAPGGSGGPSCVGGANYGARGSAGGGGGFASCAVGLAITATGANGGGGGGGSGYVVFRTPGGVAPAAGAVFDADESTACVRTYPVASVD